MFLLYPVVVGCLVIITSCSPITLERSVVPFPINSTTEIPGSGGCTENGFSLIYNKYHYCWGGGDLNAECIPSASGGHYCVCSPGFQLYSDGMCKRVNPCASGNSYTQVCINSGGTCKVDVTTRLGFTCDCTAVPGAYTTLASYDGYSCITNPCASSVCTYQGWTCTPVHGNATNTLPYVCNCPPSLVFDGKTDIPSGDCMTQTCGQGLYRNCQKCTEDLSRPYGLSCECNDPTGVSLAGAGLSCYYPCSAYYPEDWLTPKRDRAILGSGDAACRLTDTAATCYATEKSPLYYQCNCSPGYRSVFLYNRVSQYQAYYLPIDIIDNIVTCQDINECVESNPCGAQDPAATCINTVGSYICQCSSGFVFQNGKCVGQTTTPTTRPPQPTSLPTTFSPRPSLFPTTPTTPSPQPTLPPSTPLLSTTTTTHSPPPTLPPTGGACAKLDLIDGNPCNNEGDRNATCTSTCSTTYECHCSKGFWPKDGTCVDANECEFQANPCPGLGCGKLENTICRNTKGGHICSCGNGTKCKCGATAPCSHLKDRLMKCNCGTDVYYYY